ncbi:hypothetical protein IKS57_03430, partial [bacterium]|nr:hypothetical protein [bacterium]
NNNSQNNQKKTKTQKNSIPSSEQNIKDVANKLSSLITNPIALTNGYGLTAQESLANSTNNEILINAIKTAITTDISSSTLIINGYTYKTENIVSSLDISLPSSVSLANNNDGILQNVTLSYKGISIQNSSGIYYKVTNFAIATKNTNETQQNKAVASYLSSLLNGIVNITNYANITAADSLSTTSNQSNLKTSIKKAIYLEISNSNNTFVINNISYTAQDIASELTVTLPSSVSLINDENGIMQNVNLQYQSIKLTNALNTNNFTVKGFETTTIQKIGNEPISNTNNSNKEKTYTTRNEQIRSVLNNLLNQIIEISGFSAISAKIALTNTTVLTQSIISAIKTEITKANYNFTFNNVTYTIANIINEITINLPIEVSPKSNLNAQIPDVTIEYDQVNLMNNANSIDFIIEGFFKPEQINPNSAKSNQDIANELSSLIKNPIALANGYSLTAQESLANSTNNEILINAIKAAITTDISSSTLIINGYTYQTANIVSNIDILLPPSMSVSLLNNNAGILANVTLAYKGIPIENTNNNIYYKITNLAIPTQNNSNQTQQNKAVASYLSSLLNNIISIANYTNITAADSLSTTSNQLDLKTAIKTAINSSLISLYGNSIVINNISYTAKEILDGLSVTLPSFVSLINDENGIMQNVNLQYQSITLTNSSHTSNFIVTGFETTTAQIIGTKPVSNPNKNQQNPSTTRNQEIIKALNTLLNQIIIVNSYNTITASAALQNPSSLEQAIISAVQQELADASYDFTFNNVKYTITNIIDELSVNLPSSSSLNSDATQIDNVTIEYDQIKLSNKANSNYFIIEGFSSTPNPQPSKIKDSNPLNFDLDINSNQVSSQTPTTLYYFTNSFSLTNIMINDEAITSNSTGTLTYTILNSNTSSLIATKTINLLSSHPLD